MRVTLLVEGEQLLPVLLAHLLEDVVAASFLVDDGVAPLPAVDHHPEGFCTCKLTHHYLHGVALPQKQAQGLVGG